MNKVSGRVMVKETGYGIPNLLIVVYDLDPNTQSEEIFGNTQLVGDLNIWNNLQADRLGSVLTNGQGEFELNYEDSEFRIRNQEKRPDLTVLVLTPEDSAEDQQGMPAISRPYQRILHYSYIPRANAGRTESYVIRIPSTLLDRFAILYPGRREAGTDKTPQLVKSIQRTIELKSALHQNLNPIVQAQVARKRIITAKAKNFTGNLQAISLETRESPLFVRPGESIAEAGMVAMELGLKRLVETHPKLELNLIEKELEGLGIEPADLSSPGSVIESVGVCSILATKGLGPELVRIRGLLDERHARAGADSLLSESLPPTDDTPPSDEIAPDEEPSTAEQIERRIMGQIRGLPVAGNGISEDEPGLLEKLKDSIKGFQLEGGPADVTSFHDFHSLQLAFKHVWTEAFDEHLREAAERLYTAIVQLHEDFDLEPPAFEALREVNDFRRFLSAINDELSYIGISDPPDEVVSFFPMVNFDTWNSLSPGQQSRLLDLAKGTAYSRFTSSVSVEEPSPSGDDELVGSVTGGSLTDEYLLTEAERRDEGLEILHNPQGSFGRAQRLLIDIGKSLSEPYAFHYFAPDSINLGILLTYRQEWVPDTYQVGDLVATIPLAPGESRKVATKQVVKKTRAEKEIEKSLLSRSEQSQQISRAQAEIFDKATLSTNFKMTAQGSVSFGIGSVSAANEFALNQAQESYRKKTAFNESTVKAAQEYKLERSFEVETTTTEEFEVSATSEIKNTNNELTVTYLFYELQRRYYITTRLHRLTPVILVAQDIPAPHEIDEAWLLEHEWILRRVLLDDGFQTALDYLQQGFVGDELSLEVKKANWLSQRKLVETLEASVSGYIDARNLLREVLVNTAEARDLAEAGESSTASDVAVAIATGGLSLLFGSATDDSEILEAKRKAIQTRLNYIEETIKTAQQRLNRAFDTLQKATDEYTQALEFQSNKRSLIGQLRVHIKQNILYYMHTIWDHEPPDQRFFRLYHKMVTLPSPATHTCTLRLATEADLERGIPGIVRGGRRYIMECSAPIPSSPSDTIEKQLVEIADLDNPLGYKGNYIIFPLKECTHITDFMMQEFIDDYFGIRDPDGLGNFTTTELLEYAEDIWHDTEAGLSDAERDTLRRIVIDRLSSPRKDTEMIIVPTGQLFIEALKGEHALLEDFKLLHRGLDVAKVQAEVRQAELENLRRAARLIGDEYEDPDVEKKIIIKSDADEVIIPT